jgi:hypothetical protein
MFSISPANNLHLIVLDHIDHAPFRVASFLLREIAYSAEHVIRQQQKSHKSTLGSTGWSLLREH